MKASQALCVKERKEQKHKEFTQTSLYDLWSNDQRKNTLHMPSINGQILNTLEMQANKQVKYHGKQTAWAGCLYIPLW